MLKFTVATSNDHPAAASMVRVRLSGILHSLHPVPESTPSSTTASPHPTEAHSHRVSLSLALVSGHIVELLPGWGEHASFDKDLTLFGAATVTVTGWAAEVRVGAGDIFEGDDVIVETITIEDSQHQRGRRADLIEDSRVAYSHADNSILFVDVRFTGESTAPTHDDKKAAINRAMWGIRKSGDDTDFGIKTNPFWKRFSAWTETDIAAEFDKFSVYITILNL